MGFEQAAAEVERIIDAIESGGVDLERSLQEYERGVALVRRCREILDRAELKVKELSVDPSPASGGSTQPGRGPTRGSRAGGDEAAPF